jgi:hypothetical protein
VTYLALWIFELVIDNTSDANFVREFGGRLAAPSRRRHDRAGGGAQP